MSRRSVPVVVGLCLLLVTSSGVGQASIQTTENPGEQIEGHQTDERLDRCSASAAGLEAGYTAAGDSPVVLHWGSARNYESLTPSYANISIAFENVPRDDQVAVTVEVTVPANMTDLGIVFPK